MSMVNYFSLIIYKKLIITSALFSLIFACSSSPRKSVAEKPSRQDIIRTMKRVNIGSCLSREPRLRGKGKIKVHIVAVSSGAIKTASVLNAPFKSSPISTCLEREVRKQRFSSFTKSNISFIFPFGN